MYLCCFDVLRNLHWICKRLIFFFSSEEKLRELCTGERWTSTTGIVTGKCSISLSTPMKNGSSDGSGVCRFFS